MESSSRIIYLRTGEKCQVSLEDFESLEQHTWRCTSHGYVVAQITGKPIYIHRFVTNAPKGMQVDHIDHDRLNNQRSNLRICTPAENNLNRVNANIYYCVQRSKWCAQIKLSEKTYHLGMFQTKIDAEKAYSSAALYYYKAFAHVPYPAETPQSIEQIKWAARQNNPRGESRYSGVSKRNRLWVACIMVSRQQIQLGTFGSEEEAARAYDSAIDAYNLPTWKKNFYPLEFAS